MGLKNKLGQEEMVGFVLIVILVIIILMIFLGLSLRHPVKETVESYEVDNFMQVLLSYTTNCQDETNNYLIIKDLIKKCSRGRKCSDNRDTCKVLNDTLSDIMNLRWDVGKESQYKAYVLNISYNNKPVIYLKKGNLTNNYKGPRELLGFSNSRIDLKIYY